jgi:hypothetical protein
LARVRFGCRFCGERSAGVTGQFDNCSTVGELAKRCWGDLRFPSWPIDYLIAPISRGRPGSFRAPLASAIEAPTTLPVEFLAGHAGQP